MIEQSINIELLVLAAGSSKRLGEPKQLLKYKENSLIRNIVLECHEANIGNITVVAGYLHEEISKEINDLPVDVFFNRDWEEGIGSSIRNGITHILSKNSNTTAILITTIDQPFIESSHLKKICTVYQPGKKMIVASAYAGTFGVPLVVDTYYFHLLQVLKGDEGGKKVFVNYLNNIVEIPFRGGDIDIDKNEDLKWLK